MNWLRSRKRPASFVPRVERLEERAVPAAILTGTSLTVTGNNIRVVDLGTDSASVTNAITVTSDGVTQTFGGDISSITINGKPGADKVVYTLGGSNESLAGAPVGSPTFLVTRASREVTTKLDSSARDEFTLVLQPEQTFVGAHYKFTVNGGAKGNDYAVRSDGLTIDSKSALDLNLLGGEGNDNITINLDNTAVSPAINPGFAGETPPSAGSAAPRIGLLGFMVRGRAGNDQLFANVSLTDDSQGFVIGNVNGGVGDDLVGLIVDLPPPRPTVGKFTGFKQSPPTLELAGGLGTNTGISTTNVTTSGLDAHLIVP
jgi:hypothetical protein